MERDEFGFPKVPRREQIRRDRAKRRVMLILGAQIVVAVVLLMGFYVWGLGRTMWLPVFGEMDVARISRRRGDGAYNTVFTILAGFASLYGVGCFAWAMSRLSAIDDAGNE